MAPCEMLTQGRAGTGLASVLDAKTVMEQYLDTLQLPTDPAAYEFRDLKLPSDNPFAASASAARVKQQWSRWETPTPDFLETNLQKERSSQLIDMQWNDVTRRLSTYDAAANGATLDLAAPGTNRVCLVAASGAGKTRLLFEEGYKAFGVYLVADTKNGSYGSSDLEGFLRELPSVADERHSMSELDMGLRRQMYLMMLSRVVLFERLKRTVSDFLPRHWLAAQLHPVQIFESDIFALTISAANKAVMDLGSLKQHWNKSGLHFLALDEAQVADKYLPNTFPSLQDPNIKRSALSCLLRVVSTDFHSHIVLSGTGLNVESAFTTLASSLAVEGLGVRLVGVTSFLNSNGVGAALFARGVTTLPDEHILRRFAGRPRFAMRLAAGLLLGIDPNVTAEEIIQGRTTPAGAAVVGLHKMLARLQRRPASDVSSEQTSSKTVYSELRAAALTWVLKGLSGISQGGEVALEAGVCALDVSKSDGKANLFVIKEALVVQAFTDLADAEFKQLSRESAAQIGVMFEDYLAWNAPALCSILAPEHASRLNGALGAEFAGPWTPIQPGGDERRGTLAADGAEPGLILDILDRKGARGTSLVFPGTKMGADLVVVARRADGQSLLLFVQAKACMVTSTRKAMQSLRFPYHVNRDTDPRLPAIVGLISAANALDDIMARDDVSVVFLVVKFPANSQRGYDRAKVATIREAGEGSKRRKLRQVLELVVDQSNAMEWLGPLQDGLARMEDVKSARRELFVDDGEE
jgi:hypothetical protein